MRKVARTKTWTLFQIEEELAHDQSRQFSGLAGPMRVLLFILPAVGSLVKTLSTGSEMIPLNLSQSNKKKPHPHVRWEPIKIPTKKELGGQQRFRDFSFIMQNTAFQSRGELWKKRVNKLVF